MNSGVYVIRNIVNGHRYIGSTKNLVKRWRQHQSDLNRKVHFNSYLQNAWNKYTKKSFVYEVIEQCSPDIILDREEYWIKELHSHKSECGYNFCRIPRASRLGCKASSETIKKMSAALSGKNHPNWGKTLPRSAVLKMIKSQTGVSKPTSGFRKTYEVFTPNGEKIKILGLRDFCRKNKLNVTSFRKVLLGKQKEHKGWKSIYDVKVLPSACKSKTPVVAICDKKEYLFNSMMEAIKGDLFDSPIFQQNISFCCNNHIKSCGKINGKKVYWRYK